MSAARRQRREQQLQLRREAKHRGIQIGSARHLAWLILVSRGLTADQAVEQLNEWDLERVSE